MKDQGSRTDSELKEKRKLQGTIAKVVFAIGVGLSLFHLVVLSAVPMDPWILRAVHLSITLILAFSLFKATDRSPISSISITDGILILLSVVPFVYILYNAEDLMQRGSIEPTTMDIVVGVITILCIFEAARRIQGLALPILCLIMMAYALLGSHIPGFFGHKGFSFTKMVSFLFTSEGIYGMPISASATFIILFILFGNFLQASGGGRFFVDLALSVAGGVRGGPAKVAVIASMLFGTISGSPAANVATTGAFTIPLMKSIGYRSVFAGAVEAVASTGGSIMPPVMGAVAFVMAELAGIPYGTIAIAAFVPAVLYYFSVMLMVDLEAEKLGLRGLPKEKLPRLRAVLRHDGHLIIPVAVLIISLVVMGVSPVRSALYSMVATIIVSWARRTTRIGLQEAGKALYQGAASVVNVAIPCAEAGIITGIFALTGIGVKLAIVLINMAGGNLLLVLILGALICLILGTGLPAIPSYVISAVTVAAALTEMGIPPIVAHMFVLYYAVVSAITPPVGNAYYVAAGIAESEPQITGFIATKLGIIAYIIPIMFVYGPALLLVGNWQEIATAIVTATVGTIAIARGLQEKGLSWPERALFFAAGLMLIKPGLLTDIPGFVLFGLIAGRRERLRRREVAKAPTTAEV